jgi:hypothetical protein
VVDQSDPYLYESEEATDTAPTVALERVLVQVLEFNTLSFRLLQSYHSYSSVMLHMKICLSVDGPGEDQKDDTKVLNSQVPIITMRGKT